MMIFGKVSVMQSVQWDALKIGLEVGLSAFVGDKDSFD